MTRLLLLSIAFPLVAGCAQEKAAERDFSLYCQVKPCTCKPAVKRFGERLAEVPILWQSGGGAYCPEDYVLTPKEKIKTFKKHYGG